MIAFSDGSTDVYSGFHINNFIIFHSVGISLVYTAYENGVPLVNNYSDADSCCIQKVALIDART